MDPLDTQALHKLESSFVRAGQAAQDLRDLYAQSGVQLRADSSLGQLITEAIQLADDWAAGSIIDETDPARIIRGQHLDKIAWAALALKSVPGRTRHLLDLARGTLDPMVRIRSPAKDKLWELETWRQFNLHGVVARLEEPDVVVMSSAGPVAVACKRIYSVKNASKPLSQGVSQIERTGLPGILAVSVEDVAIPPGQIPVADNIEAAAEMLNEFNRLFINRFHSRLEAYLASGRLSCVAISTCSALYLEDSGIRECRQTQFWSHPSLPDGKKQQMAEVAALLMLPPTVGTAGHLRD